MKIIHLYASLGNRKKIAAGGGQTSARRLVGVLEGLGYYVQVVNRMVPAYACETMWDKAYKYFGYVVDPLRFFFHLLFKCRKDSLVLVIGYAGTLFPYYFLFVRIGKILGFKTSIYVKGSFTKQKYENLSARLKDCFSSGLLLTDHAFYEGKDGEEISMLVHPEKKALWLPNYIEDSFMPRAFFKRSSDIINLMYFGRLDPGKNILLIIDSFDLLCQRYDNLRLFIVGSGEINYTKQVEDRIVKSPFSNRIKRIPRIEHEKLKEFLPQQHFFMFPTESEGHSNALTEAMAYGVVPIVSRRGFNAIVVGNDKIIIDRMDAEDYANKVTDILEKGDYECLSVEMFKRVREYFTQNVVEQELKNAIDSL